MRDEGCQVHECLFAVWSLRSIIICRYDADQPEECRAQQKIRVADNNNLDFNIASKILLPLLSIPEEDLIYKSLPRIEKLEGDYTFAVMGDNKNSISTFGKMIEMINKNPEIAFVVNTGDMVFLSNRPPRQSHQRNLQRNTTLLYNPR